MLAQYNGADTGWDGTYMGENMPNTDYKYGIWIEEINQYYEGYFRLCRGGQNRGNYIPGDEDCEAWGGDPVVDNGFCPCGCPNITNSRLTVLSSNVDLGSVISMSEERILTTMLNTTTMFGGTATLYALTKAGKLFTGWSDGNLDNPRVVSVARDSTFTANFADCESLSVRSTQAAISPLKVYPNPVNNTLNIELENHVNATLAIFDMSGKIVLSQPVNGNSAQINMLQFNAGNYILRLVENGIASVGVQVIKQ